MSIKREQKQDLEKVVGHIRRHFQIPDDQAFHCRVLLNHHARRKHGLGHLSDDSAREAIASLLFSATAQGMQICSASSVLADADVLFWDSSGVFPDAPNDPKAYFGLLALQALAPFAHDVEAFVSRDRTKIRFLGRKRYQAHKGITGFISDPTVPKGLMNFSPRVVEWEDEPLLQLADAAAYVVAHTDLGLTDLPPFWPQVANHLRFARRIQGQLRPMDLQMRRIPGR